LAGAAHLGGMVAGFAYLWGRATYAVWQRRRQETLGSAGGGRGFGLGAMGGKAAKKKKKIQPQHLKLVINNKNKVELTEDDDGKPPTFH
jgi:hypothetical protein